jgi:Phosphotransferase enzyme family
VAVGLGEELARGSRSAVFAWGRDAVAKVPFPSTPDGWIHYEALYTEAVHKAGAPAPELLGIESVGDRPASIYRRVGGSSMWKHITDVPGSIPAHARTLAELQAHLTTLVAPVSLPAMRDRLSGKIRVAARRWGSALLDALDALPIQPPSRLCHGDLHPGNVIMGRDGPVIIDWFDVSRGDPVADVARTVLLLSVVRDGAAGPSHLAGAGPEIVARTRWAYLAAANELLAPDPDELRRWEAVASVARLAEGLESDGLLDAWNDWRLATWPGVAGRPDASTSVPAVERSAIVLDDFAQVVEHRRRGRDHEAVVLRARQLDGGAGLSGDE